VTRQNGVRIIRLGTLAIFAAALVAASATAQEANRALPYDYVFSNYAMTELDSGGIEIGGSIEVASRIHVFGAYQDWESDDAFDRTAFHIGGGYHWTLSPRTDLVAKLAYADTELAFSNQSSDLTGEGLILSGEIRAWVGQRVELSGEVLFDDSLDDLETVLELGAQLHRSSTLSFGGRVRIDEEDTTLLLGARFYFGPSAR
jgi:hypothetical protein